MDKEENINIIYQCGDHVQFEYGNEFGFYAKQLDRNKLLDFCEEMNYDKFVYSQSYRFSLREYRNGKYEIVVKNYKNNIEFPIRLLDHSIYFALNQLNWEKIENNFFAHTQAKWIKFLEKTIPEYETCSLYSAAYSY